MHMCVHATPEGEPSVTLIYLLICRVTSQPLPCSGTDEEKHTCVAEHTHFHVLFLQALRPERGAVASGQWSPPTLPCLYSSFCFSLALFLIFFFFLTKSHLLNIYPSEKRDYAIKNTSVNVTRALGKLFGHYHTDSGIYFDPFLQRYKLKKAR